ncbi:MAG: rhodanese-like domain-containing protein [Solirubrobacterales bacterium]
MTREATLTTVEELLAEAAAEIDRLTPAEAHEAARHGDLLIDIRPVEQRQRDGLVPEAAIVDRNVLEWRLDPDGEHRNPALARRDRRVILICNEGYQSILAAAILRRFDLEACDVIGGVKDWMAAGLPLDPAPA